MAFLGMRGKSGIIKCQYCLFVYKLTGDYVFTLGGLVS